MKNILQKAIVFTLAVTMSGITAMAEKYVIYPVPRSQTMNSGSLTMTEKVNVICERTIDAATRNRLASVLAENGILPVFDGTDENSITVRLGTVGSGEQVESHALDILGLSKTRFMVSGKFDRHALSISEHGICILGEHTNAVFCGIASLEQILEQRKDGTLEYTTIYDRADQQNRGLVEGYYGYPYSVEVKKDLMRYMMRYKMNTYMYGAKSDPYHSQMWKDAYPTTITEQQEKNGWLTQNMIRDIAKVSAETKVNFIWAIHPGNEFLGSSTAITDIMSKFQKMYALGIRHFGVFVDDVGIPSSDADMKKNADRLTALQQAIEKKWNTADAAAEDTVRPLHFVPQIYCNSFASSVDQRQRFMTALGKIPSHITVYSTGQGVWSVPNNSHTSTIISEFGRPMGWWWNYPCNDNADGQIYPMDMYSNFLDMPAVGSGERLPTTLSNCQGIVANPMQQGQVAKTSLFSIADYAWNNSGFNNQKSWEASFNSLIKDERTRQAYHDITYYLRWNDPASMQTLTNNYKTSLENGTPNSSALLQTIVKIRQDCETVMTMKDSEQQSDRLLYTDIAPWLNTLHTYAIVTEKMLSILGNATDGHAQNWMAVKEVSDSLDALENSTLYTAYALEGMGNNISVSHRQAQLSRKYLYPFIGYLKTKAIDTYFNDPTAISAPTAISNSPLLDAKITTKSGNIYMTMPASDLDAGKYVGVMLPHPVLLDKVAMDESLLPLARYSTDGREWKKPGNATDVPAEHVGYFIFLNDTEKGIRGLTLTENTFCMSTATQAKAENVTIPDGAIYNNHTAELMADGDYGTYTCLNRNQQTQDKYVLDLGAAVTLHDVRLCMGTVNGDYPTVGRIQYSADGTRWANLKVKDSDIYNWSIGLEQNVKYSDEAVYCDFDGAGNTARYVRLMLLTANTSKWMRLYEIEVNRQYAEHGTLTTCTDGSGSAVEQLTDGLALTGLSATTASPLTYRFNRHYDVRGITFYSLPSATVQPTVCVSTDGVQWESIGTLTEACQTVNLEQYARVNAVRLEWSGAEAPAIFEIMPHYDTSTALVPETGNDLADAFALLKAKSLHALDSCGLGRKLITANSQFSSPYTESSEGSINNLLDGNLSTFWHSAWSTGDVEDGVHYIEIAMPENTEGDVVLHYGRRSSSTTHQLIKASILGVIDGTGTSAQTEAVADLDFPYGSATETLKREFTLPKAYTAIRLLERQTTGTGNGSKGFFHIGELQLYKKEKCYIIRKAETEAEALFEATSPMPSEATEEDLHKLQAAYDAFMYKVFGIVPSDISNIVRDDSEGNGTKTCHDLSGRRITTPVRNGFYIIDGKKMIVR